ncbi:cornifelin homolog A-like [Symsagittifera roscoffensis]|uniref:cornifelin homolog A-like n=1 Tax=Symsagittifera roscoffensis TaxID=84072 RepID=UPI00307B3D83
MGEWSNSLFSCFSNFKVCLMGMFIPCYLEGKIAESFEESCIMHGCVWMIIPIANFYCPAKIRGKVRESKGIEGGLCMDIVMILFCGACSICQEYKEMGLAEGLSRS